MSEESYRATLATISGQKFVSFERIRSQQNSVSQKYQIPLGKLTISGHSNRQRNPPRSRNWPKIGLISGIHAHYSRIELRTSLVDHPIRIAMSTGIAPRRSAVVNEQKLVIELESMLILLFRSLTGST